MKLYLTREASIRLQEIEDYISKDDPQRTIEFVSISGKITANPERRQVVPELSIEPIREILYKN